MTITATELKNNLGKYMQLAANEDIYITKNGHVIVKLSNPNKDKVEILDNLVGAAGDVKDSLEDIREGRLARQ